MLVVTCALVICLICMPSALGHKYQANPLFPCYNLYSSACVYAEFTTYCFEVYDGSEVKIIGKVTKYQRESCLVLLHSETILCRLRYVVMLLCGQKQDNK